MDPLVSVIIPVYNSEKYLRSAVESVLQQTYKNIELILVDDGSTDDSPVIAQSLAAENVKVFHQPNCGASVARNKGLDEARGEYIQFLDADDLIGPEKIELQLKLLQQKPGYVCTCSTVYFIDNEDFSELQPSPHWIAEGSEDPVDFLIKLYGGALIGPQYGGMVPIHSWLCPRIVLDRAGKWNEKVSVDDDGEYFCRVILASKGIIHADRGICYYRKYADSKSLSSWRNERAYRSKVKAIDLKFDHLRNSDADKVVLNRVFARLYKCAEIDTYPQFKELSAYAGKMSEKLGKVPSQYQAGPLSTFLSKIFGWRLMRRLDYYRHGK
ncbi:MAG: glycosyltransferase family 2 protein [Mucilaginibacter sp.]